LPRPKRKRRAAACRSDGILVRSAPSMPSEAIQCKPLEVVVSDRGIERAIKMLKRKLASEGVLRELKMRRHYMKPSIKRRKKQAEAARRRRKRAKVDAATPIQKP
jgi:small subunit ribosomal protein S21